MTKGFISADSHVMEPPNCYSDYIEKKYRDSAPQLKHHDKLGDIFFIDGMDTSIPMGLIAAAGKEPEEIRYKDIRFEELHRGAWDPKARAADQDRDGVIAELIYPSVGMVLCNHPDFDYKKACFDAYNRWLGEFCGGLPDRLFGLPQVTMRSPEEGIEEVRQAKENGYKGVMLPGHPAHADYDHPDYGKFYDAVIEMEMPISFHILTSKQDSLLNQRGPKINGFQAIIRGNQDIIGTFIFGGVFHRHPKLKLVCVEADAGWAPHFMYRMDHAYNRHRHWMRCEDIGGQPSEYFLENVYMTFQDDWTAFRYREDLNIDRLMWANDFPHSDATWPHSQELLAKQMADLSEAERNKVVHDNVAELYGLELH